MDILCPSKREMQHSGGDRRIVQLVDQDEAAERAIGRPAMVIAIGFEHQRAIGGDLRYADGIQFQRLGRQLFQRVDVELVLGMSNGRRCGLRAELQPISATRE